MKKIIESVVYTMRAYHLEGTLSSLKVEVEKLINLHGPDAEINWDSDFCNCGSSSKFEIKIKRLETDEEYEIRIQKEKLNREMQEKREIAEYQRLRKIYGK